MTIHQIVVEEKKKNDILKSSVFRVHYFSAIKALLLVSFLSFCGISISFAEETPIFNNDLEIAEEDIVVKKNFFYQTIKWESVTHALEYKVEIENTEDFNIKEAFVTENSNVRFSLPAGNYRYRIFVYDYLGRQASVTKWQKFEI